jgi:hypothetical protein
MQASFRCKCASELGGPLDGNPTVETSGGFCKVSQGSGEEI